MQICVALGFGNRLVAICHGINLYIGYHLSCVSSPSPVEGKHQADQSEYFRSTYSHFEYFPLLKAIWNDLKEMVMRFAERLDYQMIRFLVGVADKKHDKHNFKRGLSDITICTLNTDRELSFSNDPHVDIGDKFMSEESLKKIEQLQREVMEAKGTIHHSNAISFFT